MIAVWHCKPGCEDPGLPRVRDGSPAIVAYDGVGTRTDREGELHAPRATEKEHR
jgi:hypothetical protein